MINFFHQYQMIITFIYKCFLIENKYHSDNLCVMPKLSKLVSLSVNDDKELIEEAELYYFDFLLCYFLLFYFLLVLLIFYFLSSSLSYLFFFYSYFFKFIVISSNCCSIFPSPRSTSSYY